MAVDTETLRIMDDLRTRLPGALDAILQKEYFNVVDEFMCATNVWKEAIEFQTEVGETDYTFTPTQGRVNRLLQLTDANNQYVGCTMDVPGTIILAQIPSTIETYTATFALTITLPTTRDGYPAYPRWILDKYSMDFMDGTLARMMSQMSKPYSSREGTIFHGRKWEAAKATARGEAMRSNLYRGQRWAFPQNFMLPRGR